MWLFHPNGEPLVDGPSASAESARVELIQDGGPVQKALRIGMTGMGEPAEVVAPIRCCFVIGRRELQILKPNLVRQKVGSLEYDVA